MVSNICYFHPLLEKLSNLSGLKPPTSIRCCHQTPSWQHVALSFKITSPPIKKHLWVDDKNELPSFCLGGFFQKSFPRWRCFHATDLFVRRDSELSSCNMATFAPNKLQLTGNANCFWFRLTSRFWVFIFNYTNRNWVFPRGFQQQTVNVRCLLDKCLKTRWICLNKWLAFQLLVMT